MHPLFAPVQNCLTLALILPTVLVFRCRCVRRGSSRRNQRARCTWILRTIRRTRTRIQSVQHSDVSSKCAGDRTNIHSLRCFISSHLAATVDQNKYLRQKQLRKHTMKRCVAVMSCLLRIWNCFCVCEQRPKQMAKAAADAKHLSAVIHVCASPLSMLACMISQHLQLQTKHDLTERERVPRGEKIN